MKRWIALALALAAIPAVAQTPQKYYYQMTGTPSGPASSPNGLAQTAADGQAIVSPNLPTQVNANRIICKSGAAVSHTGDTNEFGLATCTIPGGSLGPNGCVYIEALFALTNNANTKTIRYRWSTITGTAFGTSAGANFASYRVNRYPICNLNATNSQGASILVGGGGSATAVTTAAIDTTADTTLVITGQLGTAGDTITLDHYAVSVAY